MKTFHKIVFGDSRNMSLIKNEEVHLIVTSPPYWQLKDYGTIEQIGYNNTYEEYINNLNMVWKECYRVLHPGCRMCINIGDQFARSVYYGRYKVIPIRDEIIRFCETIGFDYMGTIIWQKVTTCNTSGGANIMGSFPYPRNGIVKLDYEYILLFKKLGEAPKVSNDIKQRSRLTKEEWNEYFTGHWNFPGVRQDKHLAMFPEELPKRLIKMFTFEGEIVLDPFLGSGTTTLAAKNLNRNSIGYEINQDFKEIIINKLNINRMNFIDNFEVSFENDKSEFKKEDKLSQLPYIFQDPVKIDKKIDPKKLNFGSKISKDECNTNKIQYFSVKEIISPNIVKLDNGIQVNLLGVKPNGKTDTEAINYLNEKIKGKQVFIKFDSIKYDNNNNLLVYLYLKNKTFVNMHLLKSGYVDVEQSIEYKYKQKFEKLRGVISGERMAT